MATLSPSPSPLPFPPPHDQFSTRHAHLYRRVKRRFWPEHRKREGEKEEKRERGERKIARHRGPGGILKRWGKTVAHSRFTLWNQAPGSEADFSSERRPFVTLGSRSAAKTFSLAWLKSTRYQPYVRTFKRGKPGETNSSTRPRTPHLSSPVASALSSLLLSPSPSLSLFSFSGTILRRAQFFAFAPTLIDQRFFIAINPPG